MADYVSGNTDVKVFIHNPKPGTKSQSSGEIAKDIYDYIATLDSTNNKVISISHSSLKGDKIMTMIVSGA
jgi:hypothetical protein|tara:strand:- start:191 stop:400 length:210 start_codon:yes stop_codon:yes gene_type:complete